MRLPEEDELLCEVVTLTISRNNVLVKGEPKVLKMRSVVPLFIIW